MTFDNDPFASPAPATPPAPEPAPVEAPSVERVSELGSSEAVTITLKEGGGFDAAWIVIKAPTVAQAKADLREVFTSKLHEDVTKAAESFRSGNGGTATRQSNQRPPAQSNYQAPPPPQQAAPASSAVPGDNCPHGRTHKEGVGKTGKPYSAFFCNGPRGQQCDPVWGKPPQQPAAPAAQSSYGEPPF